MLNFIQSLMAKSPSAVAIQSCVSWVCSIFSLQQKADLLAWATISNIDEQSKIRATPTQSQRSPHTDKTNWWQEKGAKHHCLNASYYSNCTSYTWVLSLQLTPCGFLNLNHVWMCNQIQTFHPVPIWIYHLSTSIPVCFRRYTTC